MAIELHHLNTHGMMEHAGDVLDGVVRLKERIAELEKENAELKEQYKDMDVTHTVHIAKMNAKIEELEDNVDFCKKKLEDAQATAYAESVDAGMRERRLKRALWFARAKRAEARKNYWYVRSVHEGDNHLWSIDGSAVKYIGCIKRSNFDWLKVWSEIECKCLAMEKKYK